MRGKHKALSEARREHQATAQAAMDRTQQEALRARIAAAETRHIQAVAQLAESVDSLETLRELRVPLIQARSELAELKAERADLRAALVNVLKTFIDEWPDAVRGVKDSTGVIIQDFAEACADASVLTEYRMNGTFSPDHPDQVRRRAAAVSGIREGVEVDPLIQRAATRAAKRGSR